MILEIKGSPRVAELVSCLNIRLSTLGAPLLPSGLNYNELLGHLRKRGIGIPFRKYEYAILQAREYLSHGFLVTQKSFSIPFLSTPLLCFSAIFSVILSSKIMRSRFYATWLLRNVTNSDDNFCIVRATFISDLRGLATPKARRIISILSSISHFETHTEICVF